MNAKERLQAITEVQRYLSKALQCLGAIPNPPEGEFKGLITETLLKGNDGLNIWSEFERKKIS